MLVHGNGRRRHGGGHNIPILDYNERYGAIISRKVYLL